MDFDKDNSTVSKTNNRKIGLLLIGIILIGANLRAPLTSVGSLISFIRDDLGISNAVAGTITTLPLLAFAFLSPFAAKIAGRLGIERTIFYSLIVLTLGISIRSLPTVSTLFAGTLLIGLAIAIGNVLLPGFIKMNFPLRIGLMTGIYAVSMNIFAALAAGLSFPISSINGFGWRGALGVWGLLAFITLVIWLPQIRHGKQRNVNSTVAPSVKTTAIWRSPLAWKITIFMGLQSLIFYTLMTWLPDILRVHGYSSGSAGWMLFLLQFSIIPVTFIMPIVAGWMKNQVALTGFTALLFFVGIAGLLYGNHVFIPLWAVMIGIACGSSFSLSMMFFTLRTTDFQQAAKMSGMAQSFGYLLAATGPVLFGGLHDLTDSWTMPLVMLLGASIILLVVGIGAGKDGVVEQ
ncbi:CynX/NimT family MFS transporter [Sporosarcina limicola]|uniref:CP family cyanate transporter-like MFS transporter n=1 Tax=Sporosarcina limicola TaxID=34101 RepID=A0A927MML7_9BACL|nr:MFS transporter [Sporosarcina limicola]MBE1557110.1 CP family cyanate transporter-like MFS transporter [Sporosarcina limicola]